MDITTFRSALIRLLRPRCRHSFLLGLRPDSAILDVGCGNNSPFYIKTMLPECAYTGIDVGTYNQTKPILADNYIITAPDSFADEISKFKNCFDAVISAHNLEHCNDREKTIEAMLGAIKPGGKLYLAFPCEASVDFPSRHGCLNYFDDPTHRDAPPSFEKIIHTLKLNQFKIEFSTRHHKPFDGWIRGLINEPESRRQAKILVGTWEYYGFESIVWARKSGEVTS